MSCIILSYTCFILSQGRLGDYKILFIFKWGLFAKYCADMILSWHFYVITFLCHDILSAVSKGQTPWQEGIIMLCVYNQANRQADVIPVTNWRFVSGKFEHLVSWRYTLSRGSKKTQSTRGWCHPTGQTVLWDVSLTFPNMTDTKVIKSAIVCTFCYIFWHFWHC